MPKQQRPKPSRVARPGTAASYTNVLLEEIRSIVKAIAERVDASEARLEKRMAEGHAELAGRIDVLTMAVKLNGEDIRRHTVAIDRLEVRFGVLELKVDSHDRRLGALEAIGVKG